MNMSKKHRTALQMRLWQINMRGHLTKRLWLNSVRNNLTPAELTYMLCDDWHLFKSLH